MSDHELREQTQIMKDKIADGLSTLDDVLPDALAVCREAAYRVLGKSRFLFRSSALSFFIRQNRRNENR